MTFPERSQGRKSRAPEENLANSALECAVRCFDLPDVVYFLAAPALRLVKIGCSSDGIDDHRIEVISSACPVQTKLLLKLPGGRELEETLHTLFAAYRKKNEWFELRDELRAFLKRATSAYAEFQDERGIPRPMKPEEIIAQHMRVGIATARKYIRLGRQTNKARNSGDAS